MHWGCRSDDMRIINCDCTFLPGVGPCYSPSPYTPRYSHCSCTCPDSSVPPCYCGNHGPSISYQHSFHISTESGYHRSGKAQNPASYPTTRGGCCRWHLLPLCFPQAIQHIEGTQGKGGAGEEEQRRAVIVTSGRVLSDAAGSDTASNSDGPDDCSLPWVHPWRLTYHTLTCTHTPTHKPQAEQGYGSLQTHSALVQWKSLLVRLKHLFCFLNQYTSCCTVIGSPYGLHLDTHTCSLFCFFSFPLLMSSADPSFTHLHKLSSLNYRKTNRATTSLTINALFYWILELSNVN